MDRGDWYLWFLLGGNQECHEGSHPCVLAEEWCHCWWQLTTILLGCNNFSSECFASQVYSMKLGRWMLILSRSLAYSSLSSLFPSPLQCSFFQLSQALFHFLSPIPVLSLIMVSLEAWGHCLTLAITFISDPCWRWPTPDRAILCSRFANQQMLSQGEILMRSWISACS